MTGPPASTGHQELLEAYLRALRGAAATATAYQAALQVACRHAASMLARFARQLEAAGVLVRDRHGRWQVAARRVRAYRCTRVPAGPYAYRRRPGRPKR